MNSMIERVARALCSYDGLPENTKHEGKPMWMSFIAEARISIVAMREPTDQMIDAGNDKLGEHVGRPAARVMWPVMIDAALEDER